MQYRGEPFFLLSDTSFGTNEQARVRFEVPGRDFGAFGQYGGADIVLYKIASPFEFLKKQKNLHRIKTNGKYVGEGMPNALGFLWDDWYRKSRRIWQDIFTSEARQGVTSEVPELRSPPSINSPTEFGNSPQFALLAEKDGFKFVQRFRYPLTMAKPIQPPLGANLTGSSSGFGMSREGNVHVPLGKLKPGLYLVEAIVGGYRAATIVFVSDTVMISKASANQMMVWAAKRDSGMAVADVQMMWQDGIGVLGNAKTDAKGIAKFEHVDPEKSYVIGRDADGGVLISENFYYDSEIYNTKIYAMTDRPLYRPGDEVNVKFMGRQFLTSRKSDPVTPGNLNLEVLDPNGTPVVTQKLQMTGQNGAQSVFRLPDNAVAGGYELRFTYKDDIYSAAFRVAEYVKPHFEISLQPDKDNFKTNENISGKLVLTYPDGKPVKLAQIQLSVRAQSTTMVDSEIQYSGMFPLKLQTEILTTDSNGVAKFSLPPAKDPSRYILTAYASDGAAYRVKSTRELLVERSASAYRLYSMQQFSLPGSTIKFDFEQVASGGKPASPVRYEIVKLETQTRSKGKIAAGAGSISLTLAESGSYSILIYDENGNVLGATSHWVSGPGVKVVKGSIEIVFDRARYKIGETAEALITFPEEVSSALFTLERDKVEKSALMLEGDNWISTQRVAPNQWRAKLKVEDEFAPNMTFSVAYVKNNEWVFQNRGILVDQAHIQLRFKTDKEVYQPGETVKVQIETLLEGKPVSAALAVGVVDEMIYVLQPEIAPNIADFFYHPRRNNVRTTSSLQFIGYDMASYRQSAPPARGSSHERGVKILERPRREDVDTAYWNGQISTDSSGRASFSFVMPDSLTRWRITGRAMSAQGMVGQRTAYLRSEKSLYAKWISPDWMRSGDVPVAALALFNQTDRDLDVEIAYSGNNFNKTEPYKAKRGINVLNVTLEGLDGDALKIEIRANKTVVDKLQVSLRHDPLKWKSPRTLVLPVSAKQTALNLPRDASNIRLSFANGAAQHFSRILADLDDYPYGCVEQTASRILPLAYALQSIPPDSGGSRAQISLQQRLQQQRLRLVYMAGPQATFGWWGNATQDSLLLTAYAYYADYTASRVLGLNLPTSHWEKLLPMFGNNAGSNRAGERESKAEPATLLHRTLALWMASDMGLPVRNMVSGVLDELERQPQPPVVTAAMNSYSSPALLDQEGNWSRAITIRLAILLAEQHHQKVPAKVAAALPAAQRALEKSNLPSAQALLLMASKSGDRAQAADRILDAVRAEMPTFDRALTLIWVNNALAGKIAGQSPAGLSAAVAKDKLQSVVNSAFSMVGLNKVFSDKTPEQGLVVPDGKWQSLSSLNGTPVWRSLGATVPNMLTLAQAPTSPMTAFVQYESVSDETGTLAVKLERKLYRMAADDSASSGEGAARSFGFSLESIQEGDAVRSNELYLEVITLTPENNTRVRYGLLEVPLPPGADVEKGTWGISLGSDSPLESATSQPSRGGYAVPVEKLDEPVVLRHLLRFSQKGKFNLPPARFYSMYAPQTKAIEASAKRRVMVVK